MKNIKSISCVILLGLALIVQLLYPIPVHADGEITPPPTDTPEVISTPLPEDTTTSVATDTPTEVVPSETPTPDPSLITPTDSVLSETPAIDPSLMTPIASSSTDIPPTEVPTLISAAALSEATTDPVETDTPTLEPPTATVASTTATPDSAATAASPDGTETTQLTLLETLQQVSSDTSVVVLDANNQPVSLSTQEAADIIAMGDPVWCPAGQAPTPGLNGCTDPGVGNSNYDPTSMQSLLGYLSTMNGGTGVNGNGTIWIASSYDSSINDPTSTGFTLDGNILTTWANNSITLQGGWSGMSGDMSIGSNSIFTVPISILNWNNDVTVNNVTINNSPNGGLLVTSYNPSTDVNINNVNIDHTTGFGLGV